MGETDSRANALALRTAQAMWADDRASQALGMRLVSVASGSAILEMAVRDDMVNGLGIMHGGLVFTLADSACAFASNSHNQRMVLQTGQITLLSPAKLGMRLIATAGERHRSERTAIYDVTVANETGETIAEFRGLVRSIPSTLVPGE